MKGSPTIPEVPVQMAKADVSALVALARLVEVLSIAFSSASEEQRRLLVSQEMLLDLEALMSEAGIPVAKITELSVAARESIAATCQAQGEDSAAVRYRREMSRLFYQPPRMAVLEGRKWVTKKHRTAESAEIGERAAVAREYARQGLRVVPGASEAEDSLQYELEYMAWLLDGEADALAAGDLARVLQLRTFRRQFAAHHLGEFCRGVSVFVEDHSEDPVLLYYARLLYLVANLLVLPL